MAVLAVSPPERAAGGAGPIVLAAALPLLFLHRHYQPAVTIGHVDADLSDAAVLAVVLAGLWSLRRRPASLQRLRVTWPAWIAWLALALAILLSTAWGSHFAGYPVGKHLTTAAKWIEYMLLAPAVVAIARNARDLRPAAIVLMCWSIVVTSVGVLQFFGGLGNLDHTPAGGRKPSLLGLHDFSSLSAAALVLTFVFAAYRRAPPWFLILVGASGAVGMVIGGAFDAVVGEVAAAIVIVAVLRIRSRLLAVVLATLTLVLAGTFAIRSQAVADGLKFLGLKHGTGGAASHVESYRQRVLLAYIGGRIFLAHPLLGVGWQGSGDWYAYHPFLDDARRRFTQPPEAFPSPQHEWGVQNAYVQSLADLGPVGLACFLAATLVPVGLALRRRGDVAAPAGAAVVLVALGAWNGYGLVAGVPLDALTWLGVGSALVGVAVARGSKTATR